MTFGRARYQLGRADASIALLSLKRGLTHLHTVANDIASSQILVGWHLKKYWFQFRVVGLVFFVKHVFLDVSVEDGADIILKAVNFVSVDNLTFHHKRRLLDNRHASIAQMVRENGRLVGLGSAHRPCVVGCCQKCLEMIVKIIVAALTAALTALTTTSCMGRGPIALLSLV